MEKQEEETENTQQEIVQSSSFSSLPLDMTSKILLTLPAKSIVRFRCVSKYWSSVTTDPYFIKSYATQTGPNLLVFFKEAEADRFFVFSIRQHNHNNPKPIYSYRHSSFSELCPLSINIESVHGLVCFYNTSTKPEVWNPTTRKFLTLPTPNRGWKNTTSVFLGYDPIEGVYKLLCLPWCHVLTLRSHQEYYRKVKTKYKPCTYFRDGSYYWRCINGVLYYQATLVFKRVIMRFDVRSEKLDVIETPSSSRSFWYMKMITYKGKLAFVGSSSMWVLEDGEKSEWYEHKFLSPDDFKLIGGTDDGELMYARNIFNNYSDLTIMYVDPKRKTSRVVNCDRIMEDFRQRNGLGTRSLFGFQLVPNHVETF